MSEQTTSSLEEIQQILEQEAANIAKDMTAVLKKYNIQGYQVANFGIDPEGEDQSKGTLCIAFSPLRIYIC